MAGLAEAGRVLGDAALLDGARRTAEFVLGRMRDGDGRLLRTYKAGRARLPGTLDDHAFVADGLVALYEATGEARWLEEAHRLTALALSLFHDGGAFYLTAAGDPGLIERPTSGHDGAIPSGMSVCLGLLVRLGDVYGERAWGEIAERAARARAADALANPFGWSNLLSALDLIEERPVEIVLAGDAAPLERAVARVYLPNRVLVRAAGAPAGLAALVAGKETAGPGKETAAAYVCRNFACERPMTDPGELTAALEKA